MRPTRRLEKLRSSASQRLILFKMLVDGYSLPVESEHDRVVAFVTIEALNLWSSFCRSFYLSCIFNAKRSTGIPIRISLLGVQTKSDAITFAIKQMRPKIKGNGPWSYLDEPTWRKPGTLLQLLQVVGASNFNQVLAGFAYPTPVFDELPRIRNFFAHRSEGTKFETMRVARTVGVSTKLRPSEIMCSYGPGRPQNVICDWLDDMRHVVNLVCH